MTIMSYFSFDFKDVNHHNDFIWNNNAKTHSVKIHYNPTEPECLFHYYERGKLIEVPVAFNKFEYTSNGICLYGINDIEIYINNDSIIFLNAFIDPIKEFSFGLDNISLCKDIISWFLKCISGYDDFAIIGDLIILPTYMCYFSILHIKDFFDKIKVDQFYDELELYVPELYGKRYINFIIGKEISYIDNLNIYTSMSSSDIILREVIKRRLK